MGTKKWRFLQNGSLNNFDFWQICFIIDQIVIPMGSGQLFLIDGPTVIVARRGLSATRRRYLVPHLFSPNQDIMGPSLPFLFGSGVMMFSEGTPTQLIH